MERTERGGGKGKMVRSLSQAENSDLGTKRGKWGRTWSGLETNSQAV